MPAPDQPSPRRRMFATAAAIAGTDLALLVLLRIIGERSGLLSLLLELALLSIPLLLVYMLWYRPVANDFAARARAHEERELQGFQDVLTQLPNRLWLQQHLALAADRARRDGETFALIVLDLRRFKVVNGTLGQTTGDRLLEQVAARLRADLSGTDAACRLGSDLFGIVRPGVDQKTASQAAERLYGLMEAPFQVDQTPIELEALCGVATFPVHADDGTLLLQRAEVALNQAKADGERYAMYRPEKDVDARRRLLMFGMLRAAPARNELILHYQPKIDLGNGDVVGAEALLRWDSSELGRVSPVEFIPLAEQTSLIKPLTAWVLEQALRQLREWENAGLITRVAVNLSARNLTDEKLPDRLKELLTQSSMDPERMTMEVTESAVMANPERAAGVLERLREIGLRLSIDDFGTGYSSLTYLRTLPAGELKIDRSFVKEIDENENNAAIAGAVINLAHSLGLKVVAEGVETEPELRCLIALGCDLAQGYLISRPIPASDFAAFVAGYPVSAIADLIAKARASARVTARPVVAAPQSSVRPSLRESLRSIRV